MFPLVVSNVSFVQRRLKSTNLLQHHISELSFSHELPAIHDTLKYGIKTPSLCVQALYDSALP